MTFHVGQKVVCIKPGEWKSEEGCNHVGPDFNDVCTVTEVADRFGECWLALAEWDSSRLYIARVFRPVRTTSTGMALLKRLLLPKTTKVEERA